MDLVIKISKELEEEFNRDRFEDSLSRVAIDIESFGFQLAGRYELETITMLREAFKNSIPVPEYLNKIKDEIDLKHYSFMANSLYDEGIRFGLMLAYQIVDKHLEENDANEKSD